MSSAEAAPLVRLNGVSKVYRTEEIETHALANVDLQIARGEYVSITGPSGSGKSTLLSILGLLDTPTAGECLYDGQPAHRLSVTQRAKLRNQYLGFVFQSFNLVDDLTVAANVALPLVYGGVSAAEHRKRAAEARGRVGMSHRANHFAPQLSGGEQQRVAVARAIVRDSAMLLADEPTGNLDSTNGQVVMELIGKLHAEGTTVCVVTHDARYAALAQRQIKLIDGRVTADPKRESQEEP